MNVWIRLWCPSTELELEINKTMLCASEVERTRLKGEEKPVRARKQASKHNTSATKCCAQPSSVVSLWECTQNWELVHMCVAAVWIDSSSSSRGSIGGSSNNSNSAAHACVYVECVWLREPFVTCYHNMFARVVSSYSNVVPNGTLLSCFRAICIVLRSFVSFEKKYTHARIRAEKNNNSFKIKFSFLIGKNTIVQ